MMRKLLSLWICLLLVVTLCPGAWYTQGKPSSGSKGGKKGDGKKTSFSESLGFAKKGPKLAGAGAAGILGGTGTGLGLGIFGRHKPGSRGHKNPQSEKQPPPYYDEHQGSHNRSRWRSIFSAADPAVFSGVLSSILPFLSLVWMRNV